jgi:TnpA family transposase
MLEFQSPWNASRVMLISANCSSPPSVCWGRTAEQAFAPDRLHRRALPLPFQALRERLRCKKIWVLGAHEWRKPRRRPPDRLRDPPRRALRQAPQAAGPRGVLIYWHIEKKSMVVHSRLINYATSEVAAMVEGAVRHGTAMALEGNYVDTHGQSEIGFAITRMLDFDLLPRIKQINKIKLYHPDRGDPDAYPGLKPAITRPIRWELIEHNYDMLVKYATAIRVGTASTEAILRRFTRKASHPVYQAMIELGRAQKTIFIARYLRDRDLQREINEGLNLIEAWNRVNTVIFDGKSGEFASNRRDQQQLGIALHILQAALVYVNTLTIQDILAEPEWARVLTAEDLRGLTPLCWAHVRPYGEVRLNMTRRLALSASHTPRLGRQSA